MLAAVAVGIGTSTAPLMAQSASGYNQPDKAILNVMQAPPPPRPSVSPTGQDMLLIATQEYPSINRVAAPYLRLAGVRIEPANHSKHDTPGGYGITPCVASFAVVHVADGKQKDVALPTGACPGGPQWSTDGTMFAFTNTTPTAVELWVGETGTGAIHKVPAIALNPMLGDTFGWMGGTHTLLVKTVPAGQGPMPTASSTAAGGPAIQETLGTKGASSTYEVRDTLTNAHDEDVFDYFAVSQLALVDAASSRVTPLGKLGNYTFLDASPDMHSLLVASLHKPYSYVTTYDRFPKKVEVWNIADPRKVTMHTVADLPLADRVPVHGVPTGPRGFSWRPTDPATLIWAEAQDGGDWNRSVPVRDKVMMQKAPFTAAPVQIEETAQRFAGFEWTEKPNVAMLAQMDENRHWEHVDIVNVDDLQQKPRVLRDRSYDDSYGDPGSPVYRVLPNGQYVVRMDGDSIFLNGRGATPQGLRPFLDEQNLVTLKTERLFRSDKDGLESFVAFSGPNTRTFLTWRQSPVDPPNAFLRTLGAPATADAGSAMYASTLTPVTHIPDPTPQVRAIKKRLVKYKRADGLDLSFTLYTPPSYVEGTRLPTILYAYPLDYASASQAGQVTGSDQTFTRLRQYQFLLLAGYAILDNAAFPIVGDPKKAYDTYLDQLVADAKAAIDEGVRLGVVDPNRVGVTGHSHGALMTANLIAHTDLFRAGVATSGSYNKTLTPFGFQNERRSVWEAPDVYKTVSPFFFADKIHNPLLIIHGEEDANPGTTPIQAKFLYEAIRGNGGTARLVTLPHEPHWYTARESNEQEVYEMVRWFDKYVKNATPRTGTTTAATAGTGTAGGQQ